MTDEYTGPDRRHNDAAKELAAERCETAKDLATTRDDMAVRKATDRSDKAVAKATSRYEDAIGVAASAERRRDHDSRDRIDELESATKTYIADLEAKTIKVVSEYEMELSNRFTRFFRTALILFAFMGVMSAAGLAGFALIINQRQDQRRESAERACVLRNEQNIGIRLVLTDNKVDKYLNKFPIEPDCKAYARRSAP